MWLLWQSLYETSSIQRTSGGALRWKDKATIGYYGLPSPATVTALDPNRPIYDPRHLYVDLLAGYGTSLFADKVKPSMSTNRAWWTAIWSAAGRSMTTAITWASGWPCSTPPARRKRSEP